MRARATAGSATLQGFWILFSPTEDKSTRLQKLVIHLGTLIYDCFNLGYLQDTRGCCSVLRLTTQLHCRLASFESFLFHQFQCQNLMSLNVDECFITLTIDDDCIDSFIQISCLSIVLLGQIFLVFDFESYIYTQFVCFENCWFGVVTLVVWLSFCRVIGTPRRVPTLSWLSFCVLFHGASLLVYRFLFSNTPWTRPSIRISTRQVCVSVGCCSM